MISSISSTTSFKLLSPDCFAHVVSYLDFKSVVLLLEAMLISRESEKDPASKIKRSLAYFEMIERGVEEFPPLSFAEISARIFSGEPNLQDAELFCKLVNIAAATGKVFRQLDLSKYDLDSKMFEQILSLPAVFKTTNIILKNFKNLNVTNFQRLAGTLGTLHLTHTGLTLDHLTHLPNLTSLTMYSFFFTEELRSHLAPKLSNLLALNLKDDYRPSLARDGDFASYQLARQELSKSENFDYLPLALRELSLSFNPGLFQSDNLRSLPQSLTTLALTIKDPLLAISSTDLPRGLTSFTYRAEFLAEEFFNLLPAGLQYLSLSTNSPTRPSVTLKDCNSLTFFQFTHYGIDTYGVNTNADWSLNLPESLKELTIDQMPNSHLYLLPSGLTQLQVTGGELNGSFFKELPQTLTYLNLETNYQQAIDSIGLPRRLTAFTFSGTLLAKNFFENLLPLRLQYLSLTTRSPTRPNVNLKAFSSLTSFYFISVRDTYPSLRESTDWLLSLPENLIELTIDEMSNQHIIDNDPFPKNLTRLYASGQQLIGNFFEKLPKTLTHLDLIVSKSFLSKKEIKKLLPNLLTLKLEEKKDINTLIYHGSRCTDEWGV